MTRSVGWWLVWGLVACGGDKDSDTSGATTFDTDTITDTITDTDTDTEPECTMGGTVEACLVYETACVQPDDTYTVAGGWFDDSVPGVLEIQLAPNTNSQSIRIEVNTDEIEVGVKYEWPERLSGDVRDTSNPDSTLVYTICKGEFTVTDWLPRGMISGEYMFWAEVGNGPCIDAGTWMSKGIVTEMAPCP